jgi:nitrite reductase/ring-hydroxylating ferredoxin subunit
MAWVRACGVDDVEPGETTVLAVDPPIAVYNIDGAFFATQDTCTHERWSLADGYLDGDVIECTLHMARFCVRTGRVLCLPAFESLRTYPVRVDGDDVLVDVDAALPPVAAAAGDRTQRV